MKGLFFLKKFSKKAVVNIKKKQNNPLVRRFACQYFDNYVK